MPKCTNNIHWKKKAKTDIATCSILEENKLKMNFQISDYRYPVGIIMLYRSLKKSMWFSKDQLQEIQNVKLQSIISHAYEHVPYYNEMFKRQGIRPRDIKTVADLVHVPVLTKDIVRERYNSLIADNSIQFKPYVNRTSGSTGTPLQFLQDKEVNIARFAFFWRLWNMLGYKPYMRWAQVDGMVLPVNDTIWRYNRALNSLQISAYALTEANCTRIVKKLNMFKPKMLRGYPSALYILALYVQNNNIPIAFEVRSVVTGAETLQPFQRQVIQKVFQAEVYDVYSLWEAVCLISECEEHTKHQHMEFSAMELLDERNTPVKAGEMGEITGTSFYNFAMPFIRYKTGDLACLTPRTCSCGMNHLMVGEIDGRKDDCVITPEGAKVSRLANAFACVDGFDYAQVIQSHSSSLDINLVRNKQFTNASLVSLEEALRERLGATIRLDFNFVDYITPSSNGKRRLVINNLTKDTA